MIEPSPDWYGSYARRSAILDYLELAALHGRTYTVDDLADLIRDNQWINMLGERIGVPEAKGDDSPGLGEEIDRALERANDVLAVLHERDNAVHGLYPFIVDQVGRISANTTDPANNAYVRLLALTIAHALAVDLTPPPYRVFELMVASALSSAGYATVGIGERARGGGGFGTVLLESCAAVGLEAYPENAPARTFANDEGCDILSNLWTHDRRLGGVQFIGQVTCAKSNDWDLKICEPAPLQWREWLGGMRSPVCYLAVPHHVEDVMRAFLMSKRDRDVVDRLRLTGILAHEKVPGEAQIVETVLGMEIS